MASEFRWNEWNIDQCTKHGCTLAEVEAVILNAGRGYPRHIGDGKYFVQGRGIGGRVVEVIYIFSPARVMYPIHAMIMITRRRRGGR